ncbi:MAG: benzoyl-CoA reductase subunit A [Candidatus Lambdaproteobacteria bacterium]|nr:benzoyl-CoA reductase subunit A [Candidatus Lambdaproteobacteria bacterium]
MKLYVGIDLGSTTTKAVVMQDGNVILGKGITNSRSNYDTACAIAKSEAFIDTRFTLFHQALEAMPGLSLDLETFLQDLEASFRLQQFLNQLEYLAEVSIGEAQSARYRKVSAPLAERLNAIFSSIAGQAPEMFGVGSIKRSEFFRDLAGNTYMRLASELAEPDAVPYDLLVNIYDKSIIKVENKLLDLTFESNIAKALKRVFAANRALSKADQQTVQRCADEVTATELDVVNSVGTGYGRARLPFPKEQIRSEILCHGLGAHYMYANTATVLDIGGQDTKAIQVDRDGIVTSFQMNDRCAAGCGRDLGYIADELNLGVQELGPLAMQSNRSVRINSTCTVFAGAELRERLNNGERREDILQGLHRAIILRAMSLLARSGGVSDEFTFTGGVANNEAAVNALKGLIEENYGRRTINISPNSIFTGAVGAALFAQKTDAPAAVH